SYLGKILIGNDKMSFATTVGYGADGTPLPTAAAGVNEQKVGILDLIANFNADRFSAYLNADYDWVQDTSLAKWGVSAAGKVKITDPLSAALRLEYVQDQTDALGLLGAGHSEIYGATGTLAYEIAQNLTLKGEARWDKVKENAGGFHEFFN